MKRGKYIIGIDAGATKSESVLYPAGKSGDELKILSFPPINYNLLGVKKTVDTLYHIIEKTRGRTSLKNICHITAGIAGARHAEDRMKIKNLLTERLDYNEVTILPDTEIAFAASFEPAQKNCGILISGTGSVLYYKDAEGKVIRIGGWGRHLGDEGSGYWIAREALRDTTRHYDGRGRRTLLAPMIEKRFGINTESILQMIYHDNFEISRVAGMVFECAEKGDVICEDIIRQAAEQLSDHFIPIKNFDSIIALTGSLFTEQKMLEKHLLEIVKEKYRRTKLIKSSVRPVMGAVRIAHSMIGK